MSVRYHCPHLDDPGAPLPSSYASSSTSLFPLDTLYFCEECDAIRCNTCVATEVASYYCPSCLFDVPSANVRADKNRCVTPRTPLTQMRAALLLVPGLPHIHRGAGHDHDGSRRHGRRAAFCARVQGVPLDEPRGGHRV
jgi:dynactin-4